jgi:predicted phage terminase large subunit-like protein
VVVRRVLTPWPAAVGQDSRVSEPGQETRRRPGQPQLVYPRLKELALEYARMSRPNVILIESNTVGDALIAELALNAELKQIGSRVVAVTPQKDKVTRMAMQVGKFATGRVFFPSRGAEKLPEFEAELLEFPHDPHDDIVDSISQALAYEFKARELWNDRSLKGLTEFTEMMAFNALFYGR